MNQFQNEQRHSLCFKEEEFLNPKFNVDQFVSKCKDLVSMATLREDLENYYKNIQLSLIELINQDYADFVSLSTNLIGTEKSIDELNLPLGQLKEEIRSVKQELESVLSNIESKLKKRQQLRDKKSRLHHLMNVVHSVEKIEKILSADPKSPDMEIFMNEDHSRPGNFLERIAGEFNQLQFHVNQSKGHPVIESIRHRVSLITTKLQENLERTFDEGILNREKDTVLRCLRTYALIDKTSYAEDLFRHLIVKPFANENINEKMLHKHGIQTICDETMKFLRTDCQIVLTQTSLKDTSEKEHHVKGFDFLVNSIWVELSEAFQQRLPMLFSAGNPNQFIKNYKIMMRFMKDFEDLCITTDSFNRLRNHPSYLAFIIKWSLPVYFQVRFQEMGGRVEVAIDSAFTQYTADKLFMTNVVGVIWQSIVLCWSDDIFVTQLTGRFWKLNIQLGSRLSNFIKSSVKTKESSITATENLLLLLGDGSYFVAKLREYFKTTIQRHIKERQEGSITVFEEALNELCENIRGSLGQLEIYITSTLASEGSIQFDNILNIPRLYRRTNRESPNQPSSYVQSAFHLMTSLQSSSSTLDEKKQLEIITNAIKIMTKSFAGFVNDLLTSVKKTEDSLLRLKQQRKTASGQNDLKSTAKSHELSDENKIRKQIALDVEHYGVQLQAFRIDLKSIEDFVELQLATEVYLHEPTSE